MHIDEAGSDHVARRIDYFQGVRIIETPDSDSTAGTDANISLDPWIPGTVDKVAPSDHDIVGLSRSARTSHDSKGEQKGPKFDHG
jgi:hypothetical protein